MTAEPSRGGSASEERWLRSFGRTKGRKLSQRQSQLLSRGLAHSCVEMGRRLGADELPGIFSQAVSEVWLEVGFGAGEHLIWQAERNPHVGLIGAEPYVNGVVTALSALESRNLGGRIKLHPEDVLSLLNWLPQTSLARAFVLFPDPWPKKRHRERRIFSPALLDKLARLLRPGAELRFASDSADYAESTIGIASRHPDFVVERVFTSANRDAVLDWPVTRYEEKARREGRSSTFLSIRRR